MAKGRVHTINLAVYPEVVTVAPGDIVRVVTEFDYVGPAQKDATMICAIWHPTLLDPHNEIVRGEKAVPIPDSPLPGNHIRVTIDLLVPSGEIGTDYGLYSSIRHVTGPDIYCEPKWLENIITIEEILPTEYTLEVTIEPPGAGHVLISPKAPYSAGEVVTLVATPYPGYEFDHWGGWPPYPGVGSTSDTLKITMTANWWVVAVFREVVPPPAEYTLEIAIEPPGAGYVTISPSKAKYSAGEVVTLTAHPSSGYEFDHWGGWPPYPGVGSTSPTLEITMTADWWVVAAFREAVPAVTTVSVALRNPPSGAENWSMALVDWDITAIIDFVAENGKDRLSVDQAAVFDIPNGWTFPLRIGRLQITRWKDGIVGGTLQQLYYVQSYKPYKWDFDKGDWVDEPDPTYREVFIPEFGSYHYNVATERFEEVAPPQGISLKAGTNFVVYPGLRQSASNALASIKDYLKIVYQWNNQTQAYEQVVATTIMTPYRVYTIEVTRDCLWTFGAKTTPPSSVSLAKGWNHVGWLGSRKSAEQALAPIINYFTGGYYWNAATQLWEGISYSTIMIPGEVYHIEVSQACTWTFS